MTEDVVLLTVLLTAIVILFEFRRRRRASVVSFNLADEVLVEPDLRGRPRGSASHAGPRNRGRLSICVPGSRPGVERDRVGARVCSSTWPSSIHPAGEAIERERVRWQGTARRGAVVDARSTNRRRGFAHHVGGVVVFGADESAEGVRPVQRVTDLVSDGHRRRCRRRCDRIRPRPMPPSCHRRRLIEEVEVLGRRCRR